MIKKPLIFILSLNLTHFSKCGIENALRWSFLPMIQWIWHEKETQQDFKYSYQAANFNKKKSNLIYTISSFIRTTVTTATLEEALVWRKYERLETRPVYETNSASESVEVRGESYIIFKKCHWEMWDPSLLGLYPKLETKTHNIPASAAALFSLNLSPVRTHSYTLWRWNVSVCMCVF